MKPTLKQFLQVHDIIQNGEECPEELSHIYEGLYDTLKNMIGGRKTAGKTADKTAQIKKAEFDNRRALANHRQQRTTSQGKPYGGQKFNTKTVPGVGGKTVTVDEIVVDADDVAALAQHKRDLYTMDPTAKGSITKLVPKAGPGKPPQGE